MGLRKIREKEKVGNWKIRKRGNNDPCMNLFEFQVFTNISYEPQATIVGEDPN